MIQPIQDCDVLVIGGGITGLVSAYQLRKLKKDLLIMFPSHSTGGCIRSLQIDGFTLELGANTFALNDEFANLIEELSLKEFVRVPAVEPYRQYIFNGGKVNEVPRSPVSLLLSSLFSLGEKLRILRGLVRGLSHLKNPTVGVGFSDLFGRSVVDRVVDPALRGIFGGDIDKLILRNVFPRLGEHLLNGGSTLGYLKGLKGKRKIFCFEGGNSKLIEALFSRLTGEYVDDFVTDISREKDGRFRIFTGDNRQIVARSLVIASSGKASAAYLRSILHDSAKKLSAIRYAPVTTLHFSLSSKTKLPREGFGVLFPSNSSSKLMGILFNSILFPHTAPEGKTLITVCVGGVGNEMIASMEEKELLALVQREVTGLFEVHDIRFLHLHRWPSAIPQFESSIEDIFHQIQDFESKIEGLYFLGVDTGGIGVPDRIKKTVHGIEARFLPSVVPHTITTKDDKRAA